MYRLEKEDTATLAADPIYRTIRYNAVQRPEKEFITRMEKLSLEEEVKLTACYETEFDKVREQYAAWKADKLEECRNRYGPNSSDASQVAISKCFTKANEIYFPHYNRKAKYACQRKVLIPDILESESTVATTAAAVTPNTLPIHRPS